MNLEIKDIPTKIKPLLLKFKEYAGFIVILVILGAFAYTILQIRGYVTVEPNDDAYTERIQGLTTSQIDQEDIETIQDLQETNVDVKALFKEARDNPFQE